MNNPFKNIGQPLKEEPKEMKKNVFKDIAAFKFFMELASLFSLNYSEAVQSFFEKRKNNIKNK